MEVKMGISDAVSQQFTLIVVSILAGIVLSLIYDVFRAVRRVQKLRLRYGKRIRKMGLPNQCCEGDKNAEKNCCVSVDLQDFLFCLIYVVVTYVIFYFLHDGAVTGYVFVGQIAGCICYYLVFHNWIRCVLTCFFWQIYTIIDWFLCIILYPFRYFCGKCGKTLKSLLKSVKMVIINH